MQDSFYGWYLKCQSGTQTLALIPAVHQAGNKRTCSIQIITDKGAWTADFPGEVFSRKGKRLLIQKNSFGEEGIRLSIHTPELSVKGEIEFGALFPLKYDIMGPFGWLPFLECRHRVWSMRHPVRGAVQINGEKYSFQNAWGYWEGDQGRSFPREYLWTQCCFKGGSLMLSVADVPVAGIHFTGIIGIVLWEGKEYRLATYLGAAAKQIQKGAVRIRQGGLELEARLLEAVGRPLKAPAKGDMVRTIHESAACRAFYRFQKKGQNVFAFETNLASFEYEYT